MSIERGLGVLRVPCSSGVDLFTQMPLTSQLLKQALPSFSLSLIRVDDTCAPREHSSEFFDEFSHQLFASAGHHFLARSDDDGGGAPRWPHRVGVAPGPALARGHRRR